MAEHTELPWSVGNNGRSVIKDVPGMADGNDAYMVAVSSSHSLLPLSEAQANAAFIVRVVNSHDQLVKALEATLCELTACASQLAARGLKGHPDDSVSRAQKAAREALALTRHQPGGPDA